MSYNDGNALDYYIHTRNTKAEFNEIKPCKQERDPLPILNFDFFPLALSGPETHLIWKLSNCFMMIQTEMCISLQNCVIYQIS
jgi:hypothetical protein